MCIDILIAMLCSHPSLVGKGCAANFYFILLLMCCLRVVLSSCGGQPQLVVAERYSETYYICCRIAQDEEIVGTLA